MLTLDVQGGCISRGQTVNKDSLFRILTDKGGAPVTYKDSRSVFRGRNPKLCLCYGQGAFIL